MHHLARYVHKKPESNCPFNEMQPVIGEKVMQRAQSIEQNLNKVARLGLFENVA